MQCSCVSEASQAGGDKAGCMSVCANSSLESASARIYLSEGGKEFYCCAAIYEAQVLTPSVMVGRYVCVGVWQEVCV